MEGFPKETPSSENAEPAEALPLDKIMTAEEYSRMEHSERPYLYELKNGDKELFYFGAYHSRDPEDPIFSEIENNFNEVSPDLVMVEGMPRIAEKRRLLEEGEQKGDMMTKEKMIDWAGESGLALMLALRKGIACESPEPKDSDLYSTLLKRGFTQDDIFAQQVFLMLPQYHRQREQQGFEGYVKNYVLNFKVATNWESFDYSYRHALEIASRILGKEIDVENDERPVDYIDPIPWEDRKDSQTVMNEISRVTSRYRDEFMVQEIAKALEAHKKLFIVFGASHAVMQEPALRELMRQEE